MTKLYPQRSRQVAALLAATMALAPLPLVAQAEEIDTNPTPDALQQQVERTAEAYDVAVNAAQEADEALQENQRQIEGLEEEIPVQQAKSDASARQLYKFQQQSANVIDMLLSAEDFFGFLNNLDYMNRITATNVQEITKLNELKAQLEAEKTALEQVKHEADSRAVEAERALTAAQEARLEAQRQAQEAARQAAEADAAARAAAKPAASNESAAQTMNEAAENATATVNDRADWSADEATFISSWSSRIDAYLEGSPLAGQGRTFAQAAWNYGVDPRWSPAIAYTESSLGELCFLPHNAWGWGSSSWDTWEEAIDAHVRGLARGYGYTISMEAAQKYCPPTAQSWYDRTLAQMNQI